MAYFTKETTLKEMVGHIYGRNNVISCSNRPHMFIKELAMYVDYFNERVAEVNDSYNLKQEKYLNAFKNNLNDGIAYYQNLFSTFESNKDRLLQDLNSLKEELFNIAVPALQKA